MPYVQRDRSGEIIALFARPQSRNQERLEEDDQEVTSFRNFERVETAEDIEVRFRADPILFGLVKHVATSAGKPVDVLIGEISRQSR